MRPTVERLERREVPSGIVAAMQARRLRLPTTAQLTDMSLAQSPTGDGGLHINPTSPPPILPSPGTPTRRELARERFRAGFIGPYARTPPRFSSQDHILSFRGAGGSNQFLGGNYSMAFVFPRDPHAPIQGAAFLQDNNTVTQAQIGFDLVADPTTLDRHGRPTRATFTADPAVYSGTYFAFSASGTVRIRYHGRSASALFHGRVYTSGLTNPARNLDLTNG